MSASGSRRCFRDCPTPSSRSIASSGRPGMPVRANVWTRVLYLPPGTREHFLEQLGRDWPDHVPSTRSSIAAGRTSPKNSDARIQANRPGTTGGEGFAEPAAVSCRRRPTAEDELAAPRRPTAPASDVAAAFEPHLVPVDAARAIDPHRSHTMRSDAPDPLAHPAADRAALPPGRRGRAGDHVGHRPLPGHPAADQGLLGVPRDDHGLRRGAAARSTATCSSSTGPS